MTLAELLAAVRSGVLSPEAAASALGPRVSLPSAQRLPRPERAIAVVGMACRLPGAPDLDAFWELLTAGRDAIRPIPEDRWPLAGFYDPDPASGRSYVREGGFLEDAGRFDARFFGLSDDEAAKLDPQQRLFMEVGWSAMEHAARAGRGGQRTGLYLGARASDYTTERMLAGQSGASGRADILGHSQNYLAAWLADRMDLGGPALVVDTACSSSLMATHLAIQGLLAGDCDAALVGGVDLLLSPMSYLLLCQARVLSPGARCRTFDRRADGYVPGEGAGAVVLRRLEDALADGDTVHALILGSAVNNDGRTMGITTPNAVAQREVVRSALRRAGVPPETVTLIEAHGTGTTIGDPIEVRGLREVFADVTERGVIALGAVKSNIGHLHSAAGVAGLLKLVLALKKRQIPPTLHCEEPNPRLDLERSPLFVNRALRDWTPPCGVRRAGVSAFGFGGTNAHLVLQEAPEAPPTAPSTGPWALRISGSDERAARALAEALARALDGGADPGDLVYSVNTGRAVMGARAVATSP
ncbi:polyketide synthase, partial [Myxococcota bacterium]|nr:polyketide synthase [Myxococcota bacterium]